MARLLFEVQGVRRRAGPLAVGVVYVVYTDEAATVLADISSTVGGSAIPGSSVTVANIEGLGPAALRFYGPPDGTDVLFLRCPSDPSLGVQEIEAGGDADLSVLEGRAVTLESLVVNVLTYGAVGDAKLILDANMSSGSAVLTSATASFTSADVNKLIAVHGADGGAVLYGYIISRQSATQVTLGSTASTTVTDARTVYGSDNYGAFVAAEAAASAIGGTMYVPPAASNRGWMYLGELVLSRSHLAGSSSAPYSRTDSTAWYGTVLVPVSTDPDKAAVKTTKGARGTRVANLTIDMCNMQQGSSGLNFTRSQTKGIHVDGSWNTVLENIQIRHVPPAAAALFIDDGSPSLGCFWGHATNVFIDQYSKNQWQQGITDPATLITEPSKSTSAKGVVVYGATNPVTAWTFDQVTSYRGWYIKGTVNSVFLHCHSENAPLHCVLIDGAGAVGLASSRLKFIGGFYEHPGIEKASGDVTDYQTFKGVNTPHLVRLEDLSSVGTGPVLSEWGDGFVLDYGDPLSDIGANPTGDRWWQHGSLRIDRADVGQFLNNPDVRLIGPFVASSIAASSDTTIVPAQSGSQVHDATDLYNPATGVFTFAEDSGSGVGSNYKVSFTYAIYLKANSGTWAAGDYADLKLIMSNVKFPALSTVSEIKHRHYLMPGAALQLAQGTFEFTISTSASASFLFKLNHNYASGMLLGISSADNDRGYINYRAVA